MNARRGLVVLVATLSAFAFVQAALPMGSVSALGGVPGSGGTGGGLQPGNVPGGQVAGGASAGSGPASDWVRVRPPGACSDGMVPAAMAAQFGGPVKPGDLTSPDCEAHTPAQPRGGEPRGEGSCGGLPVGARSRPAGFTEPAHIFTPHNDSFVGDSGAIPVYQGELQTRWNANRQRMEFLVEAHIGTNLPDPDYNLGSMFARVVVFDASGAYTWYQYNSASVSDGHQYCYAQNDGFADGYVSMWVPLPLNEPGFMVRVEIRSNTSVGGPWYCAIGNDCILGNDEAYVHVGPHPQNQLNPTVIGAVGVALDRGIIQDPNGGDEGPDDVESLVSKWSQTFLPQAVASIPSNTSDPDSNFWATTVSTLNSITAPGARISSIALVDKPLGPASFDHDENVLRITVPTTQINLDMELKIGSWLWNGVLTCDVQARVPVSFEADVQIDRNPSNPGDIDLGIAGIRFNVGDVDADISGWLASFPAIMPFVKCDGSVVRPKIIDGIKSKVQDLLTGFANDPTKILDKIEPVLSAVDLSKGPLVSVAVGNSSVSVGPGEYRQTCIPQGCDGGDVLMWPGGIDIGADLAVGDGKAAGANRTFPSSYAPTASGLEGTIHQRTRPDGSSFDLAAFVRGATVNQILRALAEGGAGGGGIFDVAGPSLGLRPTVAPMYLPTAPAGFDLGGAVKVFVPNLEMTASFANYRTESVDLRIGLDAALDPASFTLDATADARVDARGLQLDRPAGINWTLDLSWLIPADIQNWLQHDLPTALANGMLQPFKVNALEALFDLPLLDGLELGPVSIASKDGYLGVWADVDAAPIVNLAMTPVYGNGHFHEPTTVKFDADPDYFPGSGDYTVYWTIIDAGLPSRPVIFETPAGTSSTSVELPGYVFFYTDDIPHEARVDVEVTVSRGGRTATESKQFTFDWMEHP